MVTIIATPAESKWLFQLRFEKNSEYYFLLGRAYQELKLNLRAFEAYSKSIFLDNKNFKAYLNRGMVRGALKDFDGAFEDLNKANSLQPNKPEYFLNLGIVYASLTIDCKNSLLYNV